MKGKDLNKRLRELRDINNYKPDNTPLPVRVPIGFNAMLVGFESIEEIISNKDINLNVQQLTDIVIYLRNNRS